MARKFGALGLSFTQGPSNGGFMRRCCIVVALSLFAVCFSAETPTMATQRDDPEMFALFVKTYKDAGIDLIVEVLPPLRCAANGELRGFAHRKSKNGAIVLGGQTPGWRPFGNSGHHAISGADRLEEFRGDFSVSKY